MMATLDKLLVRIRDGIATADELAHARELARHDARLPEELRACVLDTDVASEAAALLSILGEDGAFGMSLREALSGEAGDEADVSAAALAELGERPIDVAGALCREAGDIDVLAGVLAGIGGDLPAEPLFGVDAAVRAEAGEAPDVSIPVARELEVELPPVAEAIIDEAGQIEVDAAVLAELELERLAVGEAVRAEAGELERAFAASVLAACGLEAPAPVAEAARDEAGEADIADRVMLALAPEALAGLLDRELDDATHRLVSQELMASPDTGRELTAMVELARDLREATAHEAGEVPQLWAAIAGEIGIGDPESVPGWDTELLGEAIRAEAGDASVADAVLAEVQRREAVLGEMPLADLTPPEIPAAVNSSRWSWGALVMAAVALLVVGVSQYGTTTGPVDVGVSTIASVPAELDGEVLAFAAASEVVVDNLEYASNVHVMQAEGDKGALIIWVDEEAVL